MDPLVHGLGSLTEAIVFSNSFNFIPLSAIFPENSLNRDSFSFVLN